MNTLIEKILWALTAALAVTIALIALRHYLGLEFIPYAPGRKLNNPLAGLLVSLLALAAVNPARRDRWTAALARAFASPLWPWAMAALIALEGFLLHIHLKTHNHPLWDLDFERGVGTYLSTLLLFALAWAAISVRLLGRAATEADRRGWTALAALFLYLSMDECIGVHDEISDWATGLFQGSQAFHWMHEWLWFYAPFIALAAGYLLVFFWRATSGRARLWVLAGLFLWFAAIAFEATNRADYIPWKLSVGLEEAAEMLGTTLLLIGIARHLAAGAPRSGSARAGAAVP